MAPKKAKENPISIINSHIENSSFSRVYLFTGPEQYLINQFLTKLTDTLSGNDDMNLVRYGNKTPDVKTLISDADTLPFLADRRVILVKDSDFFKTSQDELAEYIEKIPDTTVLIFAEKNVDRKFKLYKAVAKYGTVLNFETPDAPVLTKWLLGLFSENGLKVTEGAINRLIFLSGNDMTSLSNEAEKIISFCYDKGAVSEDDVNQLCGSDAEDRVFEMIDAISLGDKKKALLLYNDLLSLKEAPIKIMALINMHYMRLASIKMMESDGTPRSDIAKLAKVPPFILGKYKSQCDKYTYKELLEIVDLCQDTGRILRSVNVNKDRTLEIFILKLLGHAGS